MSQNLRTYTAAVYQLDHVLRLVPSTAWDKPSPCEGWTVRDVAGHAMAVVANVGGRITATELIDAFMDNPGSIAGSDPFATWTGIRTRLFEVLDQPGALQTATSSTLGTLSADVLLLQMTADAVIHSWDIARGAGVDERIDPTLVEAAHGVIRGRSEEMNRAPRRFTAIVETDATADPQTRLLAFAGRRP